MLLFLDHFSNFAWVFPLHNKSDMYDTFVAFCAFVNNHFKFDIKASQCDHGGEFDDNHFHNLFHKHGIQFRFSCPKISQQNGKSEHVFRTHNNFVHTLLFQAYIHHPY